MKVLKRNGQEEDVSFDKVLNRMKNLCNDLNIDIYDIAQKVCSRIYNGVATSELDELAAYICSSMTLDNPHYGEMASRIIISNHHKNTSPSFSETIIIMWDKKLISEELFSIVIRNKEKLNSYIDYSRDYSFDYFGFKTLERAYLMKVDGKIVERPQHMFMRVSLGIHKDDFKDALETYDLMSKKYYIHATPTLFNSGTPRPQLSSCFLVGSHDSIEGIFETLKECAQISKYAGGIGLHVHDIRGKGTKILGTNGESTGIIPMLRVFNNTARYVNQCFTPDTLVYTKYGVKRMDSVTTKDYLLTNDSKYYKVNSVATNMIDEDIFEITTKYSINSVNVTPEHEIYVLRHGKPQYILACELKKNDLLGYSVPNYIEDNSEFDIDFCKFYGILLRYENKQTISLNNLNNSEFLLSYLTKKNIKHVIDNNLNTCEIMTIGWNENLLSKQLLNLPLNKSFALLEGFFDVENIIENVIQDIQLPQDNIIVYTKSLNIVMNIRYILLRVGILSAGSYSSDSSQYAIEIKKDTSDIQVVNNIIWSPIENIRTKHYYGVVYDFNMTDNHNYTVANLGLVHNSGRRNGSIAVYLEPWHSDIENFLELRKPHGNEEERTRDLFIALWIPDLFMQRVKDNDVWSLMCPNECPGLSDTYGDEFDTLYKKYELEKKYTKQIPAQKIWFKILESQIESGQPYLCYKDAANKKSNQKNVGVIKSSNLCVAPETLVLTHTGYYPIKQLRDKIIKIWNGFEYSFVKVFQTGEKQKVIKIGFDNGIYIRCTPYHKFFIKGKPQPINACDIQLGMKIANYNLPVIYNNSINLPYAYTRGLFSSLGFITYSKEINTQKPIAAYIMLSEKKHAISHFIKDQERIDVDINTNYCHVFIDHTKYNDKNLVPINYNIESRLKWLEGFTDGNAMIKDNLLVYTSCNYKFLVKIFYLLQTLGVSSRISVKSIEFINSVFIYELVVENVTQLKRLGFDPKYVCISKCVDQFHEISVDRLIDNGEECDTYCFTEPKNHSGIFNGIMTSQCTEIIEYSDINETAVCNLCSIALPTYIKDGTDYLDKFDFQKLHQVTKIATKNLNKVIDINFYPVEKARRSNLRHRPIGIGVQGLADLFVLLRLPFDSQEAANINKYIFETIYHASLEASMEIAKKRHDIINGIINNNTNNTINIPNNYLNINEYDPSNTSKYPGAYYSFENSPASQGILQFDMWEVTPDAPNKYNWDELRQNIMKYGLRNSLLLAPMPTASTSQILGFNECIEPFTSNIYKRKTLAGEFILVNKHLIRDLINTNLWNKDIKDQIILNDGSIQAINEIPQDIRDLYKTTWEIKQKILIDMAADRGAFICQSQSLNLFIDDPDFKKLSSMHFYAWSKGLKTGLYYLRSKPKAQAQKFTIDPSLNKLTNLKVTSSKEQKQFKCASEEEGGVCLVCSS